MELHKVEVDDEVYRFVKKNAEPLVDTFNTAIRRLLALEGSAKHMERIAVSSTEVISFPPGTPRALAQTLEVVKLVIDGNWSRTDATREIARRHRIANQTVISKYSTQLGITTGQFDQLLGQPKLHDLKKLLNEKFPGQQETIVQCLK